MSLLYHANTTWAREVSRWCVCVCRRNFFFARVMTCAATEHSATSSSVESLRLWAWMKRWSSSLFLRTWHDGTNQPPGVGRNESWRMIDEMGTDEWRPQRTSHADVGETGFAAGHAADTVGMLP